jgi:Sulfotransferase family
MRLNEPLAAFVRGSARSGTTLLSDILNENPEIAILVEQPLGDLAYGLAGIFWFEKHRDEQRATIAERSRKAARKRGEQHYNPIENPDRMRFPRRYPMRDRFGNIVAAVVGASLEKPSPRVIGSKTPGHWNDHELRIVQELFEQVRYVFIVRNPLDTINSIVNRRNAAREGFDLWPDKPVGEAISRYREGICLLLSCASIYPEHTYVVGYDDLVNDAAVTLEGVGRFLGVALRDVSGLVRPARPAKIVLSSREEAAVRAALGEAIDAWQGKRLTGPARGIETQLDDCIDVANAGKEYRFDAPVGERGALGSGWSGAEPKGIWSDAATADVFFRVPAGGNYRITVRFSASAASKRKPLTFRTSIAENEWTHTLRDGRAGQIVQGPVHLERGIVYRLRFEFGELQSELERGDGSDPRRKGILLRRLRIDRR